METILSVIKLIVLKVLYLIFLPIAPIGTVISHFYLCNLYKRYNRGLVKKGSFSELIAEWCNDMYGHTLWQDIICRLRQIFIVWNIEDFEHNVLYLVGKCKEMK